MSPLIFTPDEILKIHFTLHREIDLEPDIKLLTRICLDINREFADTTPDLGTVFDVASLFGAKLTHFPWSKHTNRAKETAFAVCMMYLNFYGIPMKCDSQQLFNVMRDHCTTGEHFSARLLLSYLDLISETTGQTGTASDLMKIADATLRPLSQPKNLADAVEAIKSSFTIDASIEAYDSWAC
ncbi:hypothetical protein [Idiomarina sp.]|uniref:hypothetical protein n=1 Tax=Idiomarina sp. TaxID=1874361 RepID=UPI0025C2A6D8|nr:hypothetical protein [Idiomarina sp.]